MPTSNEPSKTHLTILRILALVFVITLTTLLVIYRDQVKQLQGYGYPGIFLFSILANATIIIPMPGVLFTSAMGAVFNPFWVALAAGSGATIGEMSGYLAGFSGQTLIERSKTYERMEYFVKRYGGLTIFILALIPNPFVDIAGMIAGALKMPLYRFLIFLWFGKVGKMLIFAYLGASIMQIINKL
ncbi:MAG: VTT domain-containing protein [Anaerolineaceae bacterium]